MFKFFGLYAIMVTRNYNTGTIFYNLMDRERLFEKLDIDSPEEFKFYENLETLLEDDEHIEEELISEILLAADPDLISEHIDQFFDSFSANIPDEETELSIVLDSFRNNISTAASFENNEDSISNLSSEIYKFRKWYVIDHNAVDEKSGEEISVRDARYEILAAKLLGDEVSIDFGRALTSGPDSYAVRIRDII